LACAAAVAFLFFFVDDLFFVDDVDLDDLTNVLLCSLAAGACIGGLGGAVEALKARIRFSRLLRDPPPRHP
jgi:hypothetical protein